MTPSWICFRASSPKRDLLIKQHAGSKKARLNVDSLSYWMATNNPKDNVTKREYLDRYGAVDGLSASGPRISRLFHN